MHALSRQEAIESIRALEPALRKLGVHRLSLFGSVLKDQAREDSDVDLLVEFVPNAKTFDGFMMLADLLELTLKRRVELVTKEALSPFIGPRILAEAEDVIRAA